MNFVFFILFSAHVLSNGFESRVNININKDLSVKNQQCEQPTINHEDISQSINSPYEEKVVYSCEGSFNTNLLTRRSRLLIYSSQFKNIQSAGSGAAISYFFMLQGTQTVDTELLKETIIRDCTFQDCNAKEGGAIYAHIDQAYVIFNIINSKFIHNSATKTGGAINIIGTNITIRGCEFVNNKALEGGNDFYFSVYKYWSFDLQDAPHGFSIENCNFQCNLYKEMTSMIYLNGNEYTINFVRNTISIIDTNSKPENFVVLYNIKNTYFSKKNKFAENFLFPFDEKIAANDDMSITQYKFSECFIESPLSFKKCQTPPISFQDISTGFDSIEEKNNIYGCHGSYDKKINLKQSRLLISSCKFTSITSNENGGAIFISILGPVEENVKGNHMIEDCAFEDCASSKSGGSIYVSMKDVTDEVLITNTAFTNSYSQYGGAIYFEGNRLIIDNSQFYNCKCQFGKGCDVYFQHKDSPQNPYDFIDNISITNSLIDHLLYSGLESSIYYMARIGISCYFVNNTIILKEFTEEKNDIFKILFVSHTDTYFSGGYAFLDNCMTPYREELAANDILVKQKTEYSFSKCFSSCSNSYEKCPNLPNNNYLDISYGFREIKQGQNAYGCHGNFDKQVKISQALLLIYYCSFNTKSENDGGAVYISITNSVIDDNKGDYIIESCSFDDCLGKNGGSIYIEQKNVYATNKITNSFFKESKANANGGAIYLYFIQETGKFDTTSRYDTTIENCTFDKCTGSDGGAFYFYQDQCYMPLNVINNTFEENKATNRGGAFYFLGSRMIVNECHFNNNLATNHGSDIYLVYREINFFDDYIIKLTDMTNNDFYQSLDDTVNSLIHFESQDSYNLNFVENSIRITGNNLLNQDFSALYINIFLMEYKFENNFISPCKEEMAVKISDKVDSRFYKFKEWFPNCAIATPSHEFSDSFEFTKSFYFSGSGKFTSSFYFSDSEKFTSSFYFSDSKKFTSSFYFSESKTLIKTISYDDEHSFIQTSFSNNNNNGDNENSFTQTSSSNNDNNYDDSFTQTSSSNNDNNYDDSFTQASYSNNNDNYDSDAFSSSNQGAVNVVGNHGKKGKGLDIWMIVLIAVAALAIIIVIIIIIVVKKHKKNEEVVQNEIETIMEMQSEADFENPLYAQKQDNDPFDNFDDEGI